MSTESGARLARFGADACTVIGWSLAVLLSLDIPSDIERAQHARLAIYGFMLLCLVALIVRFALEGAHEKKRAGDEKKRNDDAARDRRIIEQMHARIEALVAAEATRPHSINADFDTTQAKVDALLLAEELNEYLEGYRADNRPEAELISDIEYIYGPSIRKSRGELADRHLTDPLLDRFSHKQEDAASVEITAQTLERLANHLPEDDSFPSGTSMGPSIQVKPFGALRRYKAFIDGYLGQAKEMLGEDAARRHLEQHAVEDTKKWKNPRPRLRGSSDSSPKS